MPKPAEADCYFCAGSGVVSAAKARATGLQPNQRCLCTVSDADVDAALPELIDDILKRIPPND